MKKFLILAVLLSAGCSSVSYTVTTPPPPQWEGSIEAKTQMYPYAVRVVEKVEIGVGLKRKW